MFIYTPLYIIHRSYPTFYLFSFTRITISIHIAGLDQFSVPLLRLPQHLSGQCFLLPAFAYDHEY